MLTFFRRIRKNLVNIGSVRKYTLYAIGEIALVVIGILIALQINNWNQNRIDRNRESIIIKQLYNELVSSYEYAMKLTISIKDRNINSSTFLLMLTGPYPGELSSDSVGYHIARAFGFGIFAPETANLNRIVYSDEINLIRSDSLKLLLSRYNAKLQQSKNQIEPLSTTNSQWPLTENAIIDLSYVKAIGADFNFMDLIEIEESRFVKDPEVLLSNPKFEAIVALRSLLYRFALRNLSDFMELNQSIQVFIQRYYPLD